MNLHEMITGLMETIASKHRCIILPHINADGDCLGSSLALANYISSKGLDVRIILEEKVPAKYDYLTEAGSFLVFEGILPEHDISISLDTGDFRRLGERGKALGKEITWNIDHHKTNTNYAKFNYVDESASSTGEIIYEILEADKFSMDKLTSSALFTAISTDTGGLRYSNTTPRSMRICAELLETGIDISEISHRAFDLTPYPKLMLKCIAIKKMEFYCNGKIAIINLDLKDYDFLGGIDEYFDGIVNITVNTEGVEAGALIRETKDGVKVNMRSNLDKIDVSVLAESLGGGGHSRAAGCAIEGKSPAEVFKIINDRLCEMV